MATLFDNARIHYHPLMFVYLIWLDYHLHKGISCTRWRCLRAESWKGGRQLEWKSNTPYESLVTIAASYNQGHATETLMTPPGLTITIFHIMLLSFTSLPFQSNLRSIAKLCESNVFCLSPSFRQWQCFFFSFSIPYCHRSYTFLSSPLCAVSLELL